MNAIYFGGGCFWCTEAAFKKIKDVKVTPGYSGGAYHDPTYKDISTGATGHAEVVEVVYDKTSLEKLLDIFFTVHDPTTKDKQGGDVGTQYRSIILYSTTAQKKTIELFIKKEQANHKEPITTEVKEFKKFYPAEDYHHNYFKKNPLQPYCMFVIRPKMKKLDKQLKEKSI